MVARKRVSGGMAMRWFSLTLPKGRGEKRAEEAIGVFEAVILKTFVVVKSGFDWIC